LSIAWNVTHDLAAVLAAILWVNLDLTDNTAGTGSARLSAEVVQVSKSTVAGNWVVWSPVSNDAVDGAFLNVTWDLLGEGGACSTSVASRDCHSARELTNATSAGQRAELLGVNAGGTIDLARICVVSCPLRNHAILWTEDLVTLDIASQSGANITTILGNNGDGAELTTDTGLSTNTASLGTDTIREILGVSEWVVGPGADLAVNRAGQGLARNSLAEGRTPLTVELSWGDDPTEDCLNSTTTGYAAIGGGSNTRHVVRARGIVVVPLGNDTVSWAALGVAWQGTNERWACGTTFLVVLDDRTELLERAVSARDRATTNGLVLGISRAVVRPGADKTVLWTWVCVTLDVTAQSRSWATTESSWDRDLAELGASTVTASNGALTNRIVLSVSNRVERPFGDDGINWAILSVAFHNLREVRVTACLSAESSWCDDVTSHDTSSVAARARASNVRGIVQTRSVGRITTIGTEDDPLAQDAIDWAGDRPTTNLARK